ncbi:MAG: methyltransferase domain-containing protein [Acidobacteriota bacterium]
MSEGVGIKLEEQLETSVDQLYRRRFPAEILAHRAKIWKILCNNWFSRYIPSTARVIEIAAGYCEFINNIDASERVAIDLNPETRKYAAPAVTVYQIAAERLTEVVPLAYFEIAFMSNFLEHCRSRDHILAIFKAIAKVLKPGGRLLILGPNFRYCYKVYFDYFDHQLPLTEKAIEEVLQLTGFEVEVSKASTLPYSFRSHLPSWPWLVQLYLKLPFLWRFFGAQYFLVGKKLL